MLRIQCNIGGFAGTPATILSVLSDDGILTIVKQTTFSEKRIKPDMSLIGNFGDELDYKFTDKDFNAAILAFFEKRATDSLIIDTDMLRFDPASKLEVDKIQESGRSYRLDQSIENGQIAILATCHFAHKQNSLSASFDLFDELYKIITV